ncbi:hypothetical protein [Geobacillus sp. LEMMY01]|uniref:hypothetical protein n=1 Tax=Geobacillus sp. LEMMY01 TaxID=1954237 RepID=UPI001118FAA4|nr:hypothetical protein [Geobacillus sp. LEMMY01]
MPGGIYDIYFQFQEGQGGAYRPVLILGFRGSRVLAIGLKITRSKKSKRFPHRIEIIHWRYAGLRSPSCVQYDWYNEIPTTTRFRKFYGMMHPYDFQRVLSAFRSYHGI